MRVIVRREFGRPFGMINPLDRRIASTLSPNSMETAKAHVPGREPVQVRVGAFRQLG